MDACGREERGAISRWKDAADGGRRRLGEPRRAAGTMAWRSHRVGGVWDTDRVDGISSDATRAVEIGRLVAGGLFLVRAARKLAVAAVVRWLGRSSGFLASAAPAVGGVVQARPDMFVDMPHRHPARLVLAPVPRGA